jgi:hypothetical protein
MLYSLIVEDEREPFANTKPAVPLGAK